jgi:hypothetical protein
MLHNGRIPEGQLVLHECDNPLCVRPSHLFLGDHFANSADAISKGRAPKGEQKSNAKMTNETVRLMRAQYVPLSRTAGIPSLAKAFGVDYKVAYRIIRGTGWKHVL